jgi:exopolysaccharide production protein ExoZ
MSLEVNRPQLVSLQLLRAFAAWMVVFHHYMQIAHGFQSATLLGQFFASRGDFGVDLFFVLSGVVMVLTLDKRDTKPLEFLKRRCLRIIPAYWAATLTLCILFPLIQHRLPLISFSFGKLISSMFFVPSPSVFSGDMYPLLTVGWTLNFEMAFYALIALMLAFRRPFSNGWIAFAVAALIVLPRINQAVKIGPWASVFGDQLIYAFPLGLIVGCIVLRVHKMKNCLQKIVLGVGFGFGAIIVAVLGEATLRQIPFSFYFGYGTFLVAGCLILSITCLEDVVAQTPGLRFWKHLGDTSYSTYLFHIMAIAFALEIVGNPGSIGGEVVLLSFSTALTLLSAEISFRVVEQRRWLAVSKEFSTCGKS